MKKKFDDIAVENTQGLIKKDLLLDTDEKCPHCGTKDLPCFCEGKA